jgi:hypothetical protein
LPEDCGAAFLGACFATCELGAETLVATGALLAATALAGAVAGLLFAVEAPCGSPLAAWMLPMLFPALPCTVDDFVPLLAVEEALRLPEELLGAGGILPPEDG